MIFLALHYSENKNIDLNSIAEELDIPKHFLSKVLQMLVKHKLLVSMKGPNGGFRLRREPDKTFLIEIIKAIDGLDIFNQCGIGFKKCDDNHPCPIHSEFKNVRNRVQKLFEQKTLQELADDVENGESFVSLGHLTEPV